MNYPDNPDANQDWLPCLPGTISDPEMTLKTRIVKRKTHVLSLGLIYFSGALIFGTFLFNWSYRPMRGEVMAPGVISCESVQQHLQAYTDMRICDCKLRASISTHLSRCSNCDLIYQRLAGNPIDFRPVETQCDFPQDKKSVISK